jgi:hypothetical protein
MESALAVVPLRIRPAASLNERSAVNDDAYLESNDSACRALTDFQQEIPFTVEADRCIEDALADMNRLGVNALLVTRRELGAAYLEVVGLVTYCDIERRHLHRHLHSTAFRERSGVRVGDAMTSCDELALVKYEALQTLTASDLYELFQGTGLTHLLVVEIHGDDSTLARGLISRATLAKRLRRSRSRSSCQRKNCSLRSPQSDHCPADDVLDEPPLVDALAEEPLLLHTNSCEDMTGEGMSAEL